MKIFLTGSSGFLGAEFARQAIEAGHELTCAGREWTDPVKMLAAPWRGCEVVVHLAAAGVRRAPPRTWDDCLEVNFHALRRLLSAIEASCEKPFVFVAGSVRESETAGRLDLWSDPYAVSKKMAGQFCEDWQHVYKGEIYYLRLAPFYGPGEVNAVAAKILCLLPKKNSSS